MVVGSARSGTKNDCAGEASNSLPENEIGLGYSVLGVDPAEV
jgi:hypothetical protein